MTDCHLYGIKGECPPYSYFYATLGLVTRGKVLDWWISKYYGSNQVITKMYSPENPRSTRQQANRILFYDAAYNWNHFDSNTKEYYNQLVIDKPEYGYSRYVKLYLLANEPMIIYWNTLEKTAGDIIRIPDYVASTYFGQSLYPPAAKKLVSLGSSGDLPLPGKLLVADSAIINQVGSTGNTLYLYRNLASASTDSPILKVVNDNAGDDQRTVHIQQDAPAGALYIDINDESAAYNVYIDMNATNKSSSGGWPFGVMVQRNFTVTDGNTYAKPGQTFQIYDLVTETSGVITDTAITLWLQKDHEHATGSVLYIRNAGTGLNNGGTVVIDDNNSANRSIYIDSELTATYYGLTLYFDVLTSGGIAQFYSNSSDATGRYLVNITNDHASAIGAVGLYINQDSEGLALYVDSACTTGTAVNIQANSLTSGIALNVNSNDADATARYLLQILNDHTSATGTVPLYIKQDAPTSTNFNKIASFNGVILWKSNGTDPNGALSGTAGDICFNGASNKPAYCTGTTNWTNFV